MSSVMLWLYRLATCWLPESRAFGFKVMLLRLAGAKVGKNVRVYSSARILGNGELEINDDVHIGPNVLIYSVAPSKVVLGSHIDIGPKVTILTGSHEIDSKGEHVAGRGVTASVKIGDGSWLCAHTLVLPGVIMAPKTVVAAGSVVTSTVVREKSLIAGVPAQFKKQY